MLMSIPPARTRRLVGAVSPALAVLVVVVMSGGQRATSAPEVSAQSSTVAVRQAVPRVQTLQKADAVSLALQLEAHLGHHSVLAADMMRARLRGDADFAEAADGALGKNTREMTAVVSAMFGKGAADAFTPLWATHVTALFNYARGVADDDAAVRADARTVLDKYEKDLAGLFAGASKGRLKQAAANSALNAHVHHLLDQADAYAAGDYVKASRLYREGFTHTFMLGRTLAETLLAPADVARLKRPQNRLHSEMSRLLGEHVALVVAATRARVMDAPDFSQLAKDMESNTQGLTGAIDALYGGPAAKTFESMWGEHVDAMIAYSAAVADDDETGKAAASRRLNSFEGTLAGFLSGATEKRLASPALKEAFLMHDGMLTEQVDLFAAEQYAEAHNNAFETYAHMGVLAGQLANAIGETAAARLPQGGAQTGFGGTAARPASGGTATFEKSSWACRVAGAL
jgi:hypothetical protein